MTINLRGDGFQSKVATSADITAIKVGLGIPQDIAAAVAGIGGGGSTTVATPIAYSTVIPLDTVDPGKTMTLTALNNIISTNTVLTHGTLTEGAVCKCIFQYNGTNTLDYTTNFYNAKSFTPASTAAGARVSLTFFAEGGSALVYGTDLPAAVAPPSFTAQSAPGGNVGSSYIYTFTASGTPTFAVGSGTLPAGLTLNSATGVVSGTPTTTGTSVFTISATNIGGTTASTSQTVTIAVATGSLAIAAFTPANIDLTAAGYIDWVCQGDNSLSTGLYDRKNGVNLLGSASYLGSTVDNNSLAGFITTSWTDGQFHTTGSRGSGRSTNITTATTNGYRFTAPAGTTSRKVRVWYAGVDFSGGVSVTVRATLSDGSATSVTLVNTYGGSGNQFLGAEITYKSASASQTLTVNIEGTVAVGAQVGILSYAYF